eukprot:795769-Pyramimonas_sp.AAC.1
MEIPCGAARGRATCTGRYGACNRRCTRHVMCYLSCAVNVWKLQAMLFNLWRAIDAVQSMR